MSLSQNGPIPIGGTRDSGAAITGEWVYPTPLILHSLGLEKFQSETHRQYFSTWGSFQLVETSRKSAEAPAPEKKWPFRRTPTQDVNRPKVFNLGELPKCLERPHQVVLSLGEGYSGLVPFLRDELKMDAFGVDLWYDEIDDIVRASLKRVNEGEDPIIGVDLMHEFVIAHRPYLLAGSATNLSGLKVNRKPNPISNQSVDLVLSHMLFDYLSPSEQVHMIDEILRVLKPGGSGRISYEGEISAEARQCLKSSNAEYDLLQVSVSADRLKEVSVPIFDSFKGESLQRVKQSRSAEYLSNIGASTRRLEFDSKRLLVIEKKPEVAAQPAK